MVCFAVRIISLLAAYALALHALIFAMTPLAVWADTPTAAIMCLNSASPDQPSGPDHQPCAPDCMMPGCGGAGWSPPVVDVIAELVPVRSSLTPSIFSRSSVPLSHKSPQIPRAPPIA